MRGGSGSRVHRLVGGDRMQWEADTGRYPQHIGAILLLDGPTGTAQEWAAYVEQRLGGVAALRRRPVRPGLGGGCWVWVDDDRDPGAHVGTEQVPDASRRTVLGRAIALAGARLPPGLAPWRAVVLTGPDDVVVALVVLLHHVLADGLGGLVLLGALVDGVPPGPPPPPPTGLPDRSVLVRDAWSRRGHALVRLPAGLRALPGARREIRGGRRARAPRSLLNRPTGARRDLDLVQVPVETLRAAARRAGGSVNDALLVAVAAALGAVAGRRGEHLPDVVLSVPVAVTDPDVRARVGNAVGAVAMPVATTGPTEARIRAAAKRRATALADARGQSLAVILVAFRLLSSLRLVESFENRQRLVTTLVTSLRGPAEPLRVNGTTIRTIVPIVATQGNQSVSFAALGYAGELTVAVTTDPDLGIGAAEVADALRAALADIVRG